MSLDRGATTIGARFSEGGYEPIYSALFEETHDFAFLLDVNGVVLEANDRVCRDTGATGDEIIGAAFSETPWFRQTDESRQRLREDLQRVAGGERVERAYRIQGPDRSAAVDISIQPVLDPRGAVEFLFLTAVETTDRDQRIAELEAKTDCLEAFVEVVSHDVSNHLAVATGNLELASERVDLEELERTRNSLARIERLLDHLSDTLRDGELIGERDSLNLAVLANEAWRYTETDGQSLVIDGSMQLRADRTRLMQVFENLYRNAVEHGSGLTVRVGTTADGFYIEDDGQGLPTEMDLFEPGVSTTSDGMGLGLSIVESIVHAHGWSIRTTEGSDGGARFEILVDDFAD